MKRSTIIAAALCLSLFPLNGCAQQQEAPAQQPSQEQIEPTVPVEQPAPIQGEQIVTEPELPQPQPIHHIPTGVWLAQTDVGYSNYYYFNSEEQNGRYLSLDYGLGMNFNYEGSGDELVFLMGDDAEAHAATVKHDEGDSFILDWENNLSEKMVFVSESTLDDFHFYSNEELIRLAVSFYSRNGDTPPSLSAAMTNEDNTVTVQLYDNLGDHNSTSAWYIFDRFTAKGTDLLNGAEIDLLAHLNPPAEEELPEGEIPEDSEEQLPTEGEELPDESETESPIEETPGEDAPTEDIPVEETPAEDTESQT